MFDRAPVHGVVFSEGNFHGLFRFQGRDGGAEILTCPLTSPGSPYRLERKAGFDIVGIE